jgi:host factor-I protein
MDLIFSFGLLSWPIFSYNKENSINGGIMANNNIQDTLLNQARKQKMEITIFLVNGFQLKGQVQAFDAFTVVLMTGGKQQLIYKHAISTIVPVKKIELNP